MHIEDWINDEYECIDCFEGHREQSGLASLNICALGSSNMRCCVNNIVSALYKIAHPNTYAHAGFDHIYRPITENVPEGLDLVSQHRDYMEIGFDGIKMIEGKPTCLKPLGGNLNNVALDKVYTEMEKNGTHVIFHMKDPEYFWKERGCDGNYYGDGTYPSYEEIQKQAFELFEKHPRLKVTLAHFFFCGEAPEILEKLFEKYPEMCVDLTPGCEMYHSFEARHDFYKEFFKKHSKRVMLGTDGTFPWATKSHVWCIGILRDFISTEKKNMAFDDSILTGMGIDGEEKENILYRNFENRVSKSPKPINKEALRRYIDKWWHLISDDERAKITPYIKKYL